MTTQSQEKVQSKTLPDFQESNPILPRGLSATRAKWRIKKAMLRGIFQFYKNPLEVLKLLNVLKDRYAQIFGVKLLSKIARVDDKYYWRLGAPGFPSAASRRLFISEVKRQKGTADSPIMQTIYFAITKKCALKCEHCFEWDNLNQPETLGSEDVLAIARKWQDYGVAQIILTGGEPLLRVNDIYRLLEEKNPATDFWIITSGLGLNEERAAKLKRLGLTGVMISLEHFEPAAHDKFRGYEGLFEKAVEAIHFANQAKLVTAISFCATKEFVNENNLDKLMARAKKLGVAFVQFLDPRAVGHFKNKDVALSEEQVVLLEKTMIRYNAGKEFAAYPIVEYPAYHQRRVGCLASGNRFFYIDTDGDAHICPFCSQKVCSSSQFQAEDTLRLLQQFDCHAFEKNSEF